MVIAMDATSISLFEGQEIRKTFHKGEWYYVVRDVVQAISSASDVKDYIKKMRKRDKALRENWSNLIESLPIETNGGRQKLNCSNMEGLFRIIEAIPTSKTIPFKRWMSQAQIISTYEIKRDDQIPIQSDRFRGNL